MFLKCRTRFKNSPIYKKIKNEDKKCKIITSLWCCLIYENSSEEFKCLLTCILQKQPNIVTQINDRQMAHLASGGEFNVTMDTEGLVWVWGKNDFGQVNTLYLYNLWTFSKSHTHIYIHVGPRILLKNAISKFSLYTINVHLK